MVKYHCGNFKSDDPEEIEEWQRTHDHPFSFQGPCFGCAKEIHVRRIGRTVKGQAHVLCDDCLANASQQPNRPFEVAPDPEASAPVPTPKKKGGSKA